MKRLRIRHHSIYEYAQAVLLGPHRLMLRPRDSHVSRLIDARLSITPDAGLRWEYDVFGNSVAIARFVAPTRRLEIDSSILLDHYGMAADIADLDVAARWMPMIYPAAEAPDLAPYVTRHYPDPERQVEEWARSFLGGAASRETLAVLHDMTRAIGDGFRYTMRFDAGTQSPATTLGTRSGTCRDFALLMMEAVRCLGVAARFVSGYLHSPSSGGGVTHGYPHAWLEVYLPGAGWIEFDPTNGLAGSDRLIRVAVSRDAEQAMPVLGSYVGTPGACINTIVRVEIEELPPVASGGATPATPASA